MTRPADADALPTADAGPGLRAILEAILLVVDEPVDASTLAQVVERPVSDVEAELGQMAEAYVEQDHGFALRSLGGGWRLYTRPDCAPWVERFVQEGQSAKLSQAALETLSVIAYQQPVTRSRIAAVRGVNVDAVVRTLQSRGLIAEIGSDPSSGAMLYVTTALFLERMGMSSLDDLPSIADVVPEAEELFDDESSGIAR